MLVNLNAFQKYDIPFTLPQPNIQPNTINFAQISATIWIYNQNLFCRLLETLIVWKIYKTTYI